MTASDSHKDKNAKVFRQMQLIVVVLCLKIVAPIFQNKHQRSETLLSPAVGVAPLLIKRIYKIKIIFINAIVNNRHFDITLVTVFTRISF